MKLLGDSINEGDVILCNHPSCGGSHLPDLTVITPVRISTSGQALFRFDSDENLLNINDLHKIYEKIS